MKVCCIIIAVILFLCGCCKEERVTDTVVDVVRIGDDELVNAGSRYYGLSLFTLFDSVEVVFPNRQDSLLMGNIKGVRYNGNSYCIFDRFNQIFLLDSDGKLISNCTRIGRGAGEYLNVFDVVWNRNEWLALTTTPEYHLAHISEAGTYLKTERFPYKNMGYEVLHPVEDTLYVFGNARSESGERCEVMTYFYNDSLYSYRVLGRRNDDGKYSSSLWHLVEFDGGELEVGTIHFDTTHVISNDVVTHRITKLDCSGEWYFLSFLYQKDGVLLFKVAIDRIGRTVLYDRNNGKARMWNANSPCLLGHYLGRDDENIYYEYRPVDGVHCSIDSLVNIGYEDVLKQMNALNLKEDDNPVILRCHVKPSVELREILGNEIKK